MKLEVGMYVRTNKGIAQINTYDKWVHVAKTDVFDFIGKSKISKASHNIIDLIEVGDYVNGHKVIYTAGEKHKLIYVEYVNMSELLEIKTYQIKSIVTKEQFSNCEYKIGE